MAGHNTTDNFYVARITVLAAAFAVTLLLRSKRRKICREPSHARSEIREHYLSRLVDGNDTASINMVHMNKSMWSVSTKDLGFAKELIGECMKLKTYGYSGREINKAYDWLMADDSRAVGFLAKDEELRKYWAEDFFESLHNQGDFLRRPT